MQVCIFSSHLHSANGWIACPELPRLVPFYDLGDLLMEIDRICDYTCFPQKWEERRSLHHHTPCDTFSRRARLMEEWEEKPCGCIMNSAGEDRQRSELSIQIMARQHASCQGRVILCGTTVFFRSSLELLGLLREALETKSSNQAKAL